MDTSVAKIRTINNIVRAEGKDFIRVNQKRQKGCVFIDTKKSDVLLLKEEKKHGAC